MKGKLGFFARLAFLAILFFLFVVMIQVNMQINELRDERDAVAQQLHEQREEVAKVQQSLDAPFSEETIRQIAKDELNLSDPGDIIYESDSPN